MGHGSPLRIWRDNVSDRDLCGWEAGPPAVTSSVAVTPLSPSPPHPFGSSNVGPKSLGPTTTNRRHRFGDQSVGGEGRGRGRGAHGEELALSSRLGLSPSRRCAQWPAQLHEEWSLNQSETSPGEESGRGEWEGPRF